MYTSIFLSVYTIKLLYNHYFVCVLTHVHVQVCAYHFTDFYFHSLWSEHLYVGEWLPIAKYSIKIYQEL